MKALLSIYRRALGLLSERERVKFHLISALSVIVSFFELFGIVSIVPFVGVVTNPQMIQDNQYLNYFYNIFNFQSNKSFLIFLGVLSLLSIFVGNIFRALYTYWAASFSYRQIYEISKELFNKYLSSPYSYFLNNEGTEISRVILTEMNLLVNHVIFSLLQLSSRVGVIILILITLIIVNPVTAITMLFLSAFAYFFIYAALKKKTAYYGNLREESNKKRFRVLNESSSAIKEVKLYNREGFYYNRLEAASADLSKSEAYSIVAADLPKYFLEAFAYGSIVVVMIYLISTEGHQNAIYLSALYAFAGYKLIPALQSIFNSMTKLKYGIPAAEQVESLRRALALTSYTDFNKHKEKMSFEDAITVNNMNFLYPKSNRTILKNINLRIKKHTMVGIIGETGSGKSTLIDCIIGLLTPSSGTIEVDGVELNSDNLASWQKNIGYVPQSPYLIDDTIKVNIAFGIDVDDIDMGRIIAVSKLAQIHDFIDVRLPEKYGTIIGERGLRLSGGQAQRISIARALYHNPEIIIFDEATSALDQNTEAAIMKTIESLSDKKTIVVITHRIAALKKADMVYKIIDGRIEDTSSKLALSV